MRLYALAAILSLALTGCGALSLASSVLSSVGNKGQQINSKVHIGHKIQNRDGYSGSNITVKNGNGNFLFAIAISELLIIVSLLIWLEYARRNPDFGCTHEKLKAKNARRYNA